MRSVCALAAGIACLAGLPAISAEPGYVDDRSDAVAVLRSLYNAVSRREFSRAWDYFGDTKPAPSFQDFVDGYRTTERVELELGPVSEEGAAGSVFFSVPVAIRATATDGSARVFAGCYTLRKVDAHIQEPPFRPILIENGRLEPAAAEFAEAVPDNCGGGSPQPPRDAVLERARAAFDATYGGRCSAPAGDGAAEPQAFTLSYRGGAEAADRQARLFRFSCSMSAYNEEAVYYLHDAIAGVRQLQFATPELDIHYVGDSQEEVESVNVVGFRTSDRLANSDYDEATMTIVSHARWRGPGDAFDAGAWLFRNGDFALVRYEVDAAYDGEASPETVLDYEIAP